MCRITISSYRVITILFLESLPAISEEPHVGESLPRSAGAAIATDGMV